MSGKKNVSIIGSPELVAHVNAIRLLGKQTVANVIEIGRHLTECKRIVGHGGFSGFLHREFGWNERTARIFMQVRKMAAASKTANFADLDLPVSAFYLLAAPSTPEPVREEIIARADRGEKLRVAHVKSAIRAARPPKKKTTAHTSTAAKAKPQNDRPAWATEVLDLVAKGEDCLQKAESIRESHPDCNGNDPGDDDETCWRRGLLYRAMSAAGQAAYEDWSQFKVDSELVAAAERAAEAWNQTASYLRSIQNKQEARGANPDDGLTIPDYLKRAAP